jgi:glycosyltransferase involved in cell wall biosynthesis
VRILYISYSCDPFSGSEDQIGWNIPITSEGLNNIVYVITKEEHRSTILKYLQDYPDIKTKFFFVDIPRIYKKMFSGLFYSLRIILWQKRALRLARKVCSENSIDLIHQVAPIEFRALGDYGKIPKVHYVAGPIGGGFPIPKPLCAYTKGHFFSESLRRVLNTVSFLLLKMSGKIKRCDYVIFTNEETKTSFDRFHISIPNNKWEYHCDIGISFENFNKTAKSNERKCVTFFVPGRLTYRKGHKLLFESIPRNIDSSIDFSFRIAGTGNFEKHLKGIVERDSFLKKHIIFLGKVPFNRMVDEYSACSAVILPSLSEATGTVLIEGMATSKPIIAANHFGAKILADSSCAWLYDGKTKEDLIANFKDCIYEAIHNDLLLEKKGLQAREYARRYTWNAKVLHFNEIYSNLLK